MTKPTLPSFNTIQPEQLVSQLTHLLDHNKKTIGLLLEKHASRYSWENTMLPLEMLDQTLHHFWAPVSHLHAVNSTDDLREAYQACLPLLTAYSAEMGQNKALYEATQSLLDKKQDPPLVAAQEKMLANEVRDFKLAGVTLDKAKQQQFRDLSEKLANLCNQFSVNVLDATQAFHYHTEDVSELAGIPALALEQAKALAKQKSLNGYVFGLDAPSYLAVMQHAENGELRHTMHYAYQTRASECGPQAGQFDNSTIMQHILEARHELAQLLAFANYATYSLATKMIHETDRVLAFLNELVEKSLPQARQEYEALQQFARDELQIAPLEAWDVAYAAEKLRQARYAISDEVIRPYFPAPKVLEGLFTIVSRLFGVRITPVKDADVWDKSVQCFAITNDDGPLAYFYLDLYTRENKRGGAWMDDCQQRLRLPDNRIQLPIAFLTCNFNPPLANQPALLSHDDVITLFHEFGHGLQHMLTTMEYSGISGINGIPWDAVEVPSQFLENWAWQREGLDLISSHVDNGEPLPDDLFQKMLDAKHFQSGMFLIRQLEFALFDFRLHCHFSPDQQDAVDKTLSDVRSQISVVPAPEYNRFAHSFGHIFAGGYAAGYYSYLWAEVMAQDAFALFLEKGLFDKATSQAFQGSFLASGGSVDPLDLFIQFRGREPSIDALLSSHGIT